MKRSEMINAIHSKLNEMSDGGLISNYWAKEILFVVENAGMVPPPVELKKRGYNCLCTMREGCPECDPYGKYYENKWEPENETVLPTKA